MATGGEGQEAFACRQKEAQQLLGLLWHAIPPLLFARQPRVAASAAECLGVLTGAIFVAGGATVTFPNPFLPSPDPSETQTLPAAPSKRRKKSRPAANVQAPAATAKRTEAVPANVGVMWAAQILAGGKCSVTGSQVSDAQQRELLLNVLRKALAATDANTQAALASQLVTALLRLLDAESTTAEELGGYLGVLLLAVEAATAPDVAKHLKDILDSFLGWSLEASCKQEDRCCIHCSERLGLL
jgi:hypothetical protein